MQFKKRGGLRTMFAYMKRVELKIIQIFILTVLFMLSSHTFKKVLKTGLEQLIVYLY